MRKHAFQPRSCSASPVQELFIFRPDVALSHCTGGCDELAQISRDLLVQMLPGSFRCWSVGHAGLAFFNQTREGQGDSGYERNVRSSDVLSRSEHAEEEELDLAQIRAARLNHIVKLQA